MPRSAVSWWTSPRGRAPESSPLSFCQVQADRSTSSTLSIGTATCAHRCSSGGLRDRKPPSVVSSRFLHARGADQHSPEVRGVKPAPFDYVAPHSLDEAVAA